MIRGISKTAIPYVPESERGVTERQTIIWVLPKDGHASNVTAVRYAKAERAGRRGRRELDTDVMDMADVEEFLSIVTRIDWYSFSDRFTELATSVNKDPLSGEDLPKGVFPRIEDRSLLERVAMDCPPELMVEVFEVANNVSQLKKGEKKIAITDLLRPLEVSKEE